MKIFQLDQVSFRLKEEQDFSWLSRYGTAFSVIDETGSGCICFGMQKGNRRYFCKIAGVNTMEAEVSPEESVAILKHAVSLYDELRHPNLIRMIEHYAYKDFYTAVFDWADGECLFDHWNFDRYEKNPALISPKETFNALPIEKRLKAADVLFSFLELTAEKGYVAVDFYDSSIIYDFDTDKIWICDIDLFLKSPVINTMGMDWYGTKRLKAPEEYQAGSVIDEKTNLFTLGALLFDFFGTFSEEDIRRRYTDNCFMPCSFTDWTLHASSYQAAKKAVSPDRENRFASIAQFHQAWNDAQKNGYTEENSLRP